MITLSQSFKAFNAMPARRRVDVVSFAPVSGSYARVFTSQQTQIPGQYPWLVEISGGGLEGNELQGTANRGEMVVKVTDYGNQISSDLQTIVLDGAIATIQTGFVGMAQGDFAPICTMKVDKVSLADQGNVYDFTLRDLGVEMQNVIYTTGDDGWPTSQKHQKSLVFNPMDLLTDVLQNQVGYAAGRINSSVIAAYKANLFPGLTLQFLLDKPPQAQDFLNNDLFKALYGYGFWNYAGKFTPHFSAAFTAAPTAALALDNTNILSPLPVEQRGDYYDTIAYRMDYDGSTFTSEVDSIYAPGVNTYGLPAWHGIQARGLRSPLGGVLYAKLVAYTLFKRYGLRPATLTLQSNWQGIALELGDVVSITHAQIKDAITGIVGLTNHYFEVRRVRPDWKRGVMELKLLDVNYLNGMAYQIAPDATPNWAASSPTQKATYMYIAANATQQYSDGTAGHAIYP